MSIRVLIINTVGLGYEGITSNILAYFSAMDRQDMTIDFVAVKAPHPSIQENIEKLGCNIYNVSIRSRHPFTYFIKLRKLISRNKYDIVHAHGNSATLLIEMFAALLGGCRCRIAHSRNTYCKHLAFDKILRPLLYRSYTTAFACGTDAGKWLFGGRPFTVIPNGKDITKFAFDPQIRLEYRQKYGFDGKVVIGHVGHFTLQKNHAFLVDTFRELAIHDPAYQLVLIGDGPLKLEVEQQILEYGLREKVLLTGRTQNVAQLLQAMDIMVLPSRYEGLPNVVLEWQIACLPCLVSDKVTPECKVTELVEFVSLESGPKTWADRTRAIKIPDRLAMAPQVKEEIAKAGYDIRVNARALKAKYQQLIVNQRGE